MATAVIIPARNEAATIGPIVKAFKECPETEGRIYVAIDGATTDNTSEPVWANGGCAIHIAGHGKGQVVFAAIQHLRRHRMLTDRIILCDGDYTGLTTEHIDRIFADTKGMVIGIPDWPDIDLPERIINSWPRVSGFRYLPAQMVPPNAHGYLLETQINQLAVKLWQPIRYVWMNGLKSPFTWPLAAARQTALAEDQEWGKANGILP